MKIIAWNCRGAAKPRFANYRKSMSHQYKLDICYLFKTRLSENALQWIQRFMGPQWEVYMILVVDLWSGIIVTRQKSLGSISFTHIDRQVVFKTISLPNESTWILRAVYASTFGLERRRLWELATSALFLGYLLYLIKDFNYILSTKDKKVGKVFQVDRDIKEFKAFLKHSSMVYLAFQDPRFTWCNNYLGLARIWEWIVRAFAYDLCMDLFSKSTIT